MLIQREEADRIARFLDLHAPPQPADLAFVFGTRSLLPIEIAADLFRRGLTRYVVLTGGSRSDLGGLIEALAHQKALLERDVLEEHIILDSESANTTFSSVFALLKIAAKINIDSVTAVTAVAKWYHSRRCLMTLKPHLPEGVRYYVASYEPEGRLRSEWYMHEDGVRRVLHEWRCIPKYLAHGHMAEVREQDGAYV